MNAHDYINSDSTSCTVYEDEKYVYGIFAILYLIVAIIAFIQIVRIIIYVCTSAGSSAAKKVGKYDMISIEHACVLIIAIFRAVLLMIRGDFGKPTNQSHHGSQTITTIDHIIILIFTVNQFWAHVLMTKMMTD